MYCSKCGKKVEDTATFCSSCGNSLEGGANQTKMGRMETSFTNSQIKMFFRIILYVVLVLAFWFISGENMFDFDFKEVTLAQLLETFIGISDKSQELSGFKLFFQAWLWVFRIGLFAYLGAAVFAFINQTYKAGICVVVGFVCHLVVAFAIVISMFVCGEELAQLFYIRSDNVFGLMRKCLKESFYLYTVLNVALFVCGLNLKKEAHEKSMEVKLEDLEFKWMMLKIFYTVLVFIVWYLANKELFVANGYGGMSIRTLMGRVFEIKQFVNESVLLAKICYWTFQLGLIIYAISVIVAFLQKEDAAQILVSCGCVCQLPIGIYAIHGVMQVYRGTYLADALQIINDDYWLYIVLNIITFICGYCFFNNISVESRYRRKPYSKYMNMDETRKLEEGEWRCEACGKIHYDYVHTCGCGYYKEKC